MNSIINILLALSMGAALSFGFEESQSINVLRIALAASQNYVSTINFEESDIIGLYMRSKGEDAKYIGGFNGQKFSAVLSPSVCKKNLVIEIESKKNQQFNVDIYVDESGRMEGPLKYNGSINSDLSVSYQSGHAAR